MRTNNKNSKVDFAGRLLVLSLVTIVFFAFNLKIKKAERTPMVEVKQTTIIESNRNMLSMTDTIPAMSYKGKKVTGMMVKSSSGMVEVKYDDGSTEYITKKEAKKRGFVLPPPPPKAPRPGKALKPHNPPKSFDGDDLNPNETFPERVFTKVEKEAEFPGGPNKWTSYIQRILTEKVRDFGDEDYGTCVVKFIVDKNGKVSDVEATTMKNTHLAQTAVEAIRKGPKWIPAMQNGQKVNAYRIIPITLKNSGR